MGTWLAAGSRPTWIGGITGRQWSVSGPAGRGQNDRAPVVAGGGIHRIDGPRHVLAGERSQEEPRKHREADKGAGIAERARRDRGELAGPSCLESRARKLTPARMD